MESQPLEPPEKKMDMQPLQTSRAHLRKLRLLQLEQEQLEEDSAALAFLQTQEITFPSAGEGDELEWADLDGMEWSEMALRKATSRRAASVRERSPYRRSQKLLGWGVDTLCQFGLPNLAGGAGRRAVSVPIDTQKLELGMAKSNSAGTLAEMTNSPTSSPTTEFPNPKNSPVAELKKWLDELVSRGLVDEDGDETIRAPRSRPKQTASLLYKAIENSSPTMLPSSTATIKPRSHMPYFSPTLNVFLENEELDELDRRGRSPIREIPPQAPTFSTSSMDIPSHPTSVSLPANEPQEEDDANAQEVTQPEYTAGFELSRAPSYSCRDAVDVPMEQDEEEKENNVEVQEDGQNEEEAFERALAFAGRSKSLPIPPSTLLNSLPLSAATRSLPMSSHASGVDVLTPIAEIDTPRGPVPLSLNTPMPVQQNEYFPITPEERGPVRKKSKIELSGLNRPMRNSKPCPPTALNPHLAHLSRDKERKVTPFPLTTQTASDDGFETWGKSKGKREREGSS